MRAPSAREFSLYAIVPTLYSPSGLEIDAAAISAAVARLVDMGVTSFLVTGAYGEFQNLTDDERLVVIDAVHDVAGVYSVMACAAHPSSRATAELASRMSDAGADSVMISAPFAAEVTEAEIGYHFEHVASHTQVPLVVYNNPIFGIDLSPEMLAKIVEIPDISAIKQGTRQIGNLIEGLAAVRTSSGGRVKILAASDLAVSATLPTGVDGLTSTNCWVFPDAFRAISDAAADQDWATVSAVAEALTAYREVVRSLGQPRTVKAAMRLRGFPGSVMVREPYVPLHDDENTIMREALEECDVALHALREHRNLVAGASEEWRWRNGTDIPATPGQRRY